MSPFVNRRRRSFARSLCIATAGTILTSCGTTSKVSRPQCPLVLANCPELVPPTDDSFGATTLKAIEVNGIYYRCREAAFECAGVKR